MSQDTAIGPARRGRQWVSLERRADFLRVGSSGLKRVTPAFILQAAPRGTDAPRSPIHVGFTASRKVGNAVLRNRIRRLIKEVFRRLRAELPPADLVVIAKPQANVMAEGGLEAVAEELVSALAQAGSKAVPKKEDT